MRSDSEIKKDVEDELRWDPDIDATDVAVSVKNGVVTLTGYVRSYLQKVNAERDAKRVAGGSRWKGIWNGTINASGPRGRCAACVA